MDENILEVCMVKPAPCSPKEDILLPLTFFDLFNSMFPPVEHLLFYETLSHVAHSVLVAKFKHSLSLTLQHFLPVTGSLVWPSSSPNPFIRYKNGDGVLLTLCQSDADFYHLSGKEFRESIIFQPLIAQIVRSGNRVPLIAIKITLFPSKGICLGITTNHSLFDGTSAMLFMNSWAYFSKFVDSRGLGEELTPVFDREVIRERYVELESSFLNILKRKEVIRGEIWSVPGPKRPVGMVRSNFILCDSDLRLLKGLVGVRLQGKDRALHVSTFAVAFAYMLLGLVKAKPPKNNKVNVFFHFDCRGRLEPPLPRNYFGNCVGACDKYLNTGELLGWEGMVFFVKFIKEVTEHLENGGVLKEAQEWIPRVFESDTDKESLIVSVFGGIKFGLESVDFGLGRPRKADIASIDGTGGLYFARRVDVGGGIEVDIILNECEMEKFAYFFHEGLRDVRKGMKTSHQASL